MISEKDSISVSFFETRKMQTKQVDCISLDGAAALFYSLLSFLAFVGLPTKDFMSLSTTAASILRSLYACVWCACTLVYLVTWGFPGDPVVKNPPANAGGAGSKPILGRSPGEANGNHLLYSCLGNPRDRGTWQATAHGVSKSWT